MKDTDTPASILIVDDQAENLQVLLDILYGQGYCIRPVTDGWQALQSARNTLPDIILLDIRMPEMDGYDVCARLKADEQLRDVPVIFLSVLDDIKDKVKAFAVGGVDYITKPFRAEEVLARVKTHLAFRNMQQRLQAALREKEILLQEVHHRVKNNMQMVSSLFRMQTEKIKDPESVEILHNMQNTIDSIALVHEMLHQAEEVRQIDMAEYLRNLVCHIFGVYESHRNKIIPHIDVEPVFLGLDAAIPCGLLVNELLINSFKHAFPGDDGGELMVSLHPIERNRKTFELVISDNGIGLPEDIDCFDLDNVGSLGLPLVSGWVNQLQGEMEIDRTAGTRFRIRFKEDISTDEGQKTN